MTFMAPQLSFLLMGGALMLLLMGLSAAIVIPAADRWSKRFFIIFFGILVLYGFLSLAESLMETRPGIGPTMMVLYFFDTLLIAALLPLLMTYVLHCSGENPLKNGSFRLEIALQAVSFIMLTMTLFTDWIYYFSPDNQFIHGPLYPVLICILFLMILLPLGCVFRFRRRLPEKYYHAFLFALVPVAVGVIPVFFTSSFILYGLGISICAFSMYLIILTDQIEQNMRQQREIAQQRASVMVLRMRPHFIYNTLMSIYGLCNQDPQKARQVTMDFTNYLRKNFNAIASENTIPFSAELEHTRAYLAVEQAQFEDLLIVEYDTPFTSFRLPPLTLQPLVENAVRHGMDPYAGPLHISVRTRHTDSGAEITVEDNGPGFDPADEIKPYTTLANIRSRLEMMCRGSMAILPREGGGAVVKITIPSDRLSAG